MQERSPSVDETFLGISICLLSVNLFLLVLAPLCIAKWIRTKKFRGRRGPRGEIGPPGPSGSAGLLQAPGREGRNEHTGRRVRKGRRGKEGPQGRYYRPGSQGPQGPQGRRGPHGRDGREGPLVSDGIKLSDIQEWPTTDPEWTEYWRKATEVNQTAAVNSNQGQGGSPAKSTPRPLASKGPTEDQTLSEKPTEGQYYTEALDMVL